MRKAKVTGRAESGFTKLHALLLMACLVVGYLQTHATTSAAVVFDETNVFLSNTEGYTYYRIPAIQMAPDGTLLAFAEGRRDGLYDPGGGDIDLVLKTSTDGGQSWSALTVLDNPGESWAASNPTTVIDQTNNATWVFYNRWEPGFGLSNSLPGTDNCQSWARVSYDSGTSWSAPIDLTHQARDYDNWGATFFGPGGAIQADSGRLLVPSAAKPGTSTSAARSYALFSDDHGASWQRGSLLDDGSTRTSECQLVELSNGRILIDVRQKNGDPNRWRATSIDEGETWSRLLVGEFVTAVSCAIERYSLVSAGGDANRIYWTGPAGPGRANLEVRVSYDEGQTFPQIAPLYNGPAAYSDMTNLGDGTMGVLWEKDNYERITFTRFNQEYVDTYEPPDRPGHVDGGPVAAGGTTPYAWYRADQGVIGQPQMAYWADQSGHDRHLSMFLGDPEETNNAPGGRTTLTFDGDDIVVGTPDDPDGWGHAAAGTIFTVFRPTGYDPEHQYDVTYVYDGCDDGGTLYRQYFSYMAQKPDQGIPGQAISAGAKDASGNVYNEAYVATATMPGGDGDILGEWLVTAVTHTTGVDDVFRVNGREVFSGNLYGEGMRGLVIGADRRCDRYEFVGDLAELIVFEGELGPTEIERIELILMVRWGMVIMVPGDTNNDGRVDQQDAVRLAANWGSSVSGGAPDGDFDGDGTVGPADAAILAANWDYDAAESHLVPEPVNPLMLLIGTVLSACRRRRQRRPTQGKASW